MLAKIIMFVSQVHPCSRKLSTYVSIFGKFHDLPNEPYKAITLYFTVFCCVFETRKTSGRQVSHLPCDTTSLDAEHGSKLGAGARDGHWVLHCSSYLLERACLTVKYALHRILRGRSMIYDDSFQPTDF